MSESLLMAPGLPPAVPSGGFNSTFNGSWVQDTSSNVFWLQIETDTNGDAVYTYYDQPGGVVSVPTGNVEPVQDSNIQVLKRTDDVNGDGTLYVTFYRLNVYDEDGAILSSNPQTPSGGAYVILGDEIDPQDEIEGLLDEIKGDNSDLNDRLAGSFVNFNFDECDLTYILSGAGIGEIETVIYKLSSITVGTITISYNAAGNISNIVRL